MESKSPLPAAGSPATASGGVVSWIERYFLGVRFVDLPRVIPGVILAAVVVAGAMWLAGVVGPWIQDLQGRKHDPAHNAVSPIMLAIVMGLVAANTLQVPRLFHAGLDFSMKRLLRLGIVLVGIKLSFTDVMKLGAVGIPVVIGVVCLALIVAIWMARLMKVPGNMGTLAAASTGICGVTATLTVGAAIEADDREIAYTVTNVTIFGMIAMFVYPWLAHALFANSPKAAGLFLGTAIHDTSQVMGAAVTYRELFQADDAFKMATVTKLARNACLAAVVPILAYFHWRRLGRTGGGKKVPFSKLFPIFIVGFLAMAVVRTLGDRGLATGLAYGTWDAAGWKAITKLVGETWVQALLGAAMASVGLTTNLRAFKGLGVKPMLLGGMTAVVVGLCGLLAASLFA